MSPSWVWSLVHAFGNCSCLVRVLFLDLPSLHVSHFGTKCFYTCLCSFVLCSVCISKVTLIYIIIESDIVGMGCIYHECQSS